MEKMEGENGDNREIFSPSFETAKLYQSAKFIIFNATFVVFDTQFLVFETQFLVFTTQVMLVADRRRSLLPVLPRRRAIQGNHQRRSQSQRRARRRYHRQSGGPQWPSRAGERRGSCKQPSKYFIIRTKFSQNYRPNSAIFYSKSPVNSRGPTSDQHIIDPADSARPEPRDSIRLRAHKRPVALGEVPALRRIRV